MSPIARWVAGLVLVGATLAAYATVARNDFVLYDDPKYVVGNAHVREGFTLGGLRWAFTTGHASNWHPTTWMSHMLDVSLFGLNAGGHHVTSLLLHALNTWLLFFLLERMTGSIGRSAFVAALFGVHPLHVESVAWVAERKDVLSTLFWFLATLAYVRWTKSPSLARYLLVVLAFAAGLTAKPMLVTLPFTLLLLDVWPLGRGGAGAWPLIREKLPLFALSAASCIVTFLVQRAGGALSSLDTYPPETRIANALVSVAVYVRKTVWPNDLAVFYPYPKQLPAAAAIAASLFVVGLISALAVRERRRQPFLLVGWLWFLGTLVPVLGFVQVGLQSMADRYTYVPLVGIFIMVAWGVPEVAVRRLAMPAGIVVLAFAACTFVQVGYWRNSKALFTHALEVTSENSVAHADLGGAFMGEGRWGDAVEQYRLSLGIRPDHAQTLYRLGTVLERLGRTDEAVDSYNHALRSDPGYVDARNALGLIEEARKHASAAQTPAAPTSGAEQLNEQGVDLARRGRIDEAIERFRKAIAQKPDFARAYTNLGLALDQKGRPDEAVASYRRAIELAPGNAEAHTSLGLSLAALSRYPEAISHYEEALRLLSNYPEALNNLGSALIAVGRADDAVDRLRSATSLRPDYAKAHYNLAVALCMRGSYADAWGEVHASRRLGFDPPRAFLKMLSDRMPEPR